MEVVVIGGSAAGPAAAFLLARAGRAVTVLEGDDLAPAAGVEAAAAAASHRRRASPAGTCWRPHWRGDAEKAARCLDGPVPDGLSIQETYYPDADLLRLRHANERGLRLRSYEVDGVVQLAAPQVRVSSDAGTTPPAHRLSVEG